jgi:uncharacterized damage-inducible protein DinB
MSRLQPILDTIIKVRAYTEDLLGNVAPDEWFRQPSEGVTHIAWHVGHIAVAEYSLGLKRIRGERAEDADLVPQAFFAAFGKGSTPSSDPSQYPSVDEICDVFDRVHRQVLAELAVLPDEVLDEQTDPHPMFQTKYEALQWAPCHEVSHTGQIALLRRLFGNAPLR